MTKRLIGLIVILVMGLSLAACAACDNSAGLSDYVDESTSTSEDSSEGDDSTQDSSSSASGGAQEGEGGTQEGDSASQSDSGDNSDDSGSDTNGGSGSDNSGTGATSGTQTGAGTGQGGFAITKQPTGGAYTAGSTVTLSITATTSSGNALSYQWFTSLANTRDGAIAIQGATGSTFNVNTSNNSNQYYYCRVTDTRGGQTYVLNSNVVNVSVTGANNSPAPTPVSYNLWIGGVQVTSANAANVLGDGTVNFNGATNTLTLNGATILYDGTADERSPIHSGLSNLTISINGTSTVKSTGGFDNTYHDGLAGIYSTGFITINGSGTLDTTGGDARNGGGAGIYAIEGLTIFSGIINAKGGNGEGGGNDTGGAGLYTDNKPLTIWGGTINATGGNSENRGGDGIYAIKNGLYIYGSPTVIAKGGGLEGCGFNGNGIYAFSGITLGDANNPFTGSLTAICGAGGSFVKSSAISENVTSASFGTVMKYYWSADGTTWSGPSDVSTPPLPLDQTRWDGVHFGATEPTPTPTSYNVWVAGTQVTSTNAADVLGNGTVSYDNTLKTLTLNEFEVEYTRETTSANAYENAIIGAGQDLTINVLGNNVIEVDNNILSPAPTAGIYVQGDLTFTGDGNINSGSDYVIAEQAHGFIATGNLTISTTGGTIVARGAVGQNAIEVGGDAVYSGAGAFAAISGYGNGVIGEVNGGIGANIGGTFTHSGTNEFVVEGGTGGIDGYTSSSNAGNGGVGMSVNGNVLYSGTGEFYATGGNADSGKNEIGPNLGGTGGNALEITNGNLTVDGGANLVARAGSGGTGGANGHGGAGGIGIDFSGVIYLISGEINAEGGIGGIGAGAGSSGGLWAKNGGTGGIGINVNSINNTSGTLNATGGNGGSGGGSDGTGISGLGGTGGIGINATISVNNTSGTLTATGGNGGDSTNSSNHGTGGYGANINNSLEGAPSSKAGGTYTAAQQP